MLLVGISSFCGLAVFLLVSPPVEHGTRDPADDKGLLGLTVEFFRIKTLDCTHDNTGNPVPLKASQFHYGTTCGLTCSPEQGPFSPIRGGSANNIYVIPTPDKLPFDTATLLAAACCIPAILYLIFMWNKILEINWKSRFGNRDGDVDELIDGTNGATVGKI